MAIIKQCLGQNGYKDADAVKDVISYVFEKRYSTGRFEYRNLLWPFGYESAIVQILCSNSFDLSVEKYIDHFILYVGNDDLSDGEIGEIMKAVVSYFGKQGFQVIAVEHYRGNNEVWGPHIHVVLGHVSVRGEVFYGRNSEYYALAQYLHRCTHRFWEYIPGSMSDYER